MDSPTVATGFAQVSKNVLKKLHDTGKYDITVVGINFHGTLTKEQMEKHPYNFTPAMPNGYADPYGRGRVIQILQGIDRDIKPPFDILFTIQDHFILAGGDELAQGYNFSKRIKEIQAEILNNQNIDMKYLFNWVGYFPVDGTLQKKWVEAIGNCDYPVAYTEFGKKEIVKFDTDILRLQERLKVIYHGVNIKDFYPMEEQEIKEFRKNYFPKEMPEDAFLIVNVSRNQTRKDVASTIKAFAEYKKINPKAYLYLHMKQYDHGGDLWEIAKQFGLEVGKDMMLPTNFDPQFGFPIEFINKIYNSADVLITTTLGEGWGFINTEAMAVKKPIITPMNTAMPEIVNINDDYFVREPSIEYIENNIHNLRGVPIKSGYGLNDWICLGAMDNGVVRPKVDIQDTVDKLNWVFNNKDKVQQIAQNGYDWVQELTWDTICKEWETIFDTAYAELEKERKLGHITGKIKQRPNDRCNCGSGKKYKVCCGK